MVEDGVQLPVLLLNVTESYVGLVMSKKIIAADERINVNGVAYGIKYHNGYRFSSDRLFNAIEGTENFDKVDDMIAYYFEDEVFNTHTSKKLFEIFDRHS